MRVDRPSRYARCDQIDFEISCVQSQASRTISSSLIAICSARRSQYAIADTEFYHRCLCSGTDLYRRSPIMQVSSAISTLGPWKVLDAIIHLCAIPAITEQSLVGYPWRDQCRNSVGQREPQQTGVSVSLHLVRNHSAMAKD